MSGSADTAVRVTVAKTGAEVVGAVLMERLGPYAEESAGPASQAAGAVTLVFYPDAADSVSDAEIMKLLPEELLVEGAVRIERAAVPRDWVDGWKSHFHPVVIGRVRVRPPWEPPASQVAGSETEGGGVSSGAAVGTDGHDSALVDVVINPGLAFGTGLHPTTRGALLLLQAEEAGAQGPAGPRGTLVDVGTGSGILSIAAAMLGWGPIVAFDDDAVALVSARENLEANGVAALVGLHECGVADAPLAWFREVTVLANMTFGPVSALVRRLPDARPSRLVVAGILAGGQERELVALSQCCGFEPGRRLYEAEWVSMELLPSDAGRATAPHGEV